jgi:putative hydrolase of the HAD superfamily
MKNNIELILFDLGGVLIELAGVPRLMEWTNNAMSVAQLWEKWIMSPAARLFESGKIEPEEFAERMVEEFSLSVPASQYLKEFIYWPKHLFPGATELLEKLSADYTLASLSNTNKLHWKRFVEEMKVTKYFTFNFPSHITGLIKPDPESYEHVIKTVNINPENILFLDDNQINVDAANKCGIKSYIANGVESAHNILVDLGVINPETN